MKLTSTVKRLSGVLALVVSTGFSLPSYAYVVGGGAGTIASDSGQWAWDGSFLAGFRAALENPANFGPTGTVNTPVTTINLGAVNSSTLSGVDMFVAAWLSDAQAAPMTAAVLSFFLAGGDLFLLQDDSSHDEIGAALGLSTTASTGSVSNGGAPLFNGPFGTATNVQQFYNVGKLDGAAIAAKNGNIGGVNLDGEITSAYWAAGQYALGAGSLFIIADIDMISTTTICGLSVCGANFTPLNDNGVYALNTFSFLQRNGGSTVPEPPSIALLGLGFLGLLLCNRKRKGVDT